MTSEPAPCEAAHRRAELEGADGYVDPATGLFVFTAAYLAARHVLRLGLPALSVPFVTADLACANVAG